jgi:peptide/nickel transport system ATP-binding protein
VFHTRCPRKLGAICEQQDPPFAKAADAAYVSQATGSAHEAANGIGRKHLIRCHIPADELRALQTASRDQANDQARDEASDVARDKPASPANGAGRDS